MEIILLEKVSKLGIMGDIVKVKNGFARNFLIPGGKAIRATEGNKKVFEAQKLEIAKQSAERKSHAQDIANSLPKAVSIIRQAGEDGKLFGSVAARDVVSAIRETADLEVAKNQVNLPEVVKFIGTHDAHVVLHPEVIATVKVVVPRTEEEAADAISKLEA